MILPLFTDRRYIMHCRRCVTVYFPLDYMTTRGMIAYSLANPFPALLFKAEINVSLLTLFLRISQFLSARFNYFQTQHDNMYNN